MQEIHLFSNVSMVQLVFVQRHTLVIPIRRRLLPVRPRRACTSLPAILAWRHGGGPHHVDDTGGETEQQEHDQPKRRGSDQAVECPAKSRADQDPGNEFARKSKPARKA